MCHSMSSPIPPPALCCHSWETEGWAWPGSDSPLSSRAGIWAPVRLSWRPASLNSSCSVPSSVLRVVPLGRTGAGTMGNAGGRKVFPLSWVLGGDRHGASPSPAANHSFAFAEPLSLSRPQFPHLQNEKMKGADLVSYLAYIWKSPGLQESLCGFWRSWGAEGRGILPLSYPSPHPAVLPDYCMDEALKQDSMWSEDSMIKLI